MANPQLIGTPEKTINGFRSKWNAVESPIVFTISNDKFPTGASVSNYYTEVNIFVNGNNIATVKQIPDSNNETKVDVRKFVKSALSFDLQSVGEDVNATAEVYITGEEKYIDNTGVSQSNPIDDNQGDNDPFYVSLSALQFGNEYGGNMYNYVVDNSKTDLAKWLTTFDRGQIVDFVDSTVSALINNQDVDFVVEQYNVNGNLIDTSTDSLGVVNGIYRFNLGLVEFSIDTSYLIVYLESSSVKMTENYFIDVDLSCVDSPNAPTDLEVTESTFENAKLEWTSNSNGQETGFSIERSVTLNDQDFIVIDVVGVGVEEYLDSSVTYVNTYYYRVRALGDIPSSYSNIANVTITADPLIFGSNLIAWYNTDEDNLVSNSVTPFRTIGTVNDLSGNGRDLDTVYGNSPYYKADDTNPTAESELDGYRAISNGNDGVKRAIGCQVADWGASINKPITIISVLRVAPIPVPASGTNAIQYHFSRNDPSDGNFSGQLGYTLLSGGSGEQVQSINELNTGSNNNTQWSNRTGGSTFNAAVMFKCENGTSTTPYVNGVLEGGLVENTNGAVFPLNSFRLFESVPLSGNKAEMTLGWEWVIVEGDYTSLASELNDIHNDYFALKYPSLNVQDPNL